MKVLRTPDERFDNLPGYPWAPHYVTLKDGLRMHYLDEGPKSAPAILMLHGEPSWSYLYRKMIPPLLAAGFRTIAPDLVGFGKSDKPAQMSDYTYQRHMDWLKEWMVALDLRGLTLICQDWGSLLGLRLAAENAERFARIFVCNGFLPTGTGQASRGFLVWRAFAKWSPWFPIGRIVASGTVTDMPPAVRDAYDAPFPSSAYKAGARQFPRLVPINADNPAVPANREAWGRLGQWQKPFLCVFGKNDPILGRADKPLIEHVPGAKGQPHDRIWGGHFVQEERGDELAKRVIDWIGRK